VLDLPGSAAIGRDIIARAGMTDRILHCDGDATTADLGGRFDCVLCFNLIHHLAQDDIPGLFAKVHDALDEGGAFAVMDAFAEPSDRKSTAANFLAMFVYLSSGSRVYTPAQLHAWLGEAGFGAPRRIPVLRIPGQAMYVAKKAN
jgi:cyclopropane fatty-acyl-phospholipid synthase-like methyltransferase